MNLNYPLEDYIINFLSRKEMPEDVQKLKEWLAADPAHRDELKQWHVAWNTVGAMEAAESINVDKAYQRFLFRVGAETPSKTTPKRFRTDKTIFMTISRIAAIFVVSFALGITCYYFFTKNQPEQIAFSENIVPLGSKIEISMPDGTTISLNAGSTLRYPTNYGKNKRDIYLSGEGYFNVAGQAGKPFTVHTTMANIKAYGTEFNVKAYPDENVMETTLINGEIVVENGEAAGAFDRVTLKPGQRATITVMEHQPEVAITQPDPDIIEAIVSCKEHNWRIESETLQDIAVKLERRYDVHITVDDRLKNTRFTGPLGDETLEQVLHYIQLSVPIQYHIDGKNVEIMK